MKINPKEDVTEHMENSDNDKDLVKDENHNPLLVEKNVVKDNHLSTGLVEKE